jgi:uncharacterized protein YggL (DUF469 family)
MNNKKSQKQFTAKTRIRRMNRRQRKKLRLQEFQELIFTVRAKFSRPLDENAYDPLLDDFIAFIESRDLDVGGMGGRLPLSETEGVIQAWKRRSPTEEDRRAVVAWLSSRPEVVEASADDFVDGWHCVAEYSIRSE